MRITWEWPKRKMAWFFWAWRPTIFNDTRFWRVGPITLSVDD